ncbi:MAG: diacylglycerol kinase family protein [Patescibacteria group bacterium]
MNVVIIFNPNSTGGSEENARQLAQQLRKEKIDVTVRKTTHAGHGEEIAAKYAHENKDIVLISSSGDGGYHEVVNGVLSVKKSKLVVGVLASGNANDHSSALGSDSLSKAIKKRAFEHIDTIKVTAKVGGEDWVRYAHSYVGIGVTANAAKRLTEDRPNVFTEKWIVLKSLLSFKYIKIKEDGNIHRYSSILFGNIDRMSKVMKLSENNSVKDGKFEISSIRFHSKLRLILYLFTAATKGLKHSQSISHYDFRTIKALPIQLDGEVHVIDAGSDVQIDSVKKNLYCVL